MPQLNLATGWNKQYPKYSILKTQMSPLPGWTVSDLSQEITMDYDIEDHENVDSDLSGKVDDESSYICNSCGEEIVVPLDYSAGQNQEYVEDCPVCCNPNVIFVEFTPDGEANIWSRGE